MPGHVGPRVALRGQPLGHVADGESIGAHGLLQPITISPDGVLLCGARRHD